MDKSCAAGKHGFCKHIADLANKLGRSYGIEHHPFRVTHRAIEFTVQQQRVQQPNLRVHSAYVPNA